YYHGARYYACWLGRWVSCDPMGLVDGNNVYVHSRSNPISRVDFSGTQAKDWQDPPMSTPGIGITIPFDETKGSIGKPSFQFNKEALAPPLTAGDSSGEWLPLVSGGGKYYRKSVEIAPVESPPPQERTFWNRGGGTLVGGGLMLGIGVLLLASNPVGWAVGL